MTGVEKAEYNRQKARDWYRDNKDREHLRRRLRRADPPGWRTCARCLERKQNVAKQVCDDCLAITYQRKLLRNKLAKFNITEERYAELLDEQAHRCAACGGEGELHIDHDHSCCDMYGSCGECVRGLLCMNCNTSAGLVGDDPARLRALAEYLEARRNQTVPRHRPYRKLRKY